MRRALPFAAVLLVGVALGHLLASGRPAAGRGPARPASGRVGEVRVTRPDEAYPGRPSHRLTVYRRHGEPVRPHPGGVADVWAITICGDDGSEDVYFARPVEE